MTKALAALIAVVIAGFILYGLFAAADWVADHWYEWRKRRRLAKAAKKRVVVVGEPIDIGHGHSISYTSWEQYEKVGLIDHHNKPDGTECIGGGVMFDLPGVNEAFPERAKWTVESWEPLTLAPSLLCTACGDHGWIKNGMWQPA